MAAQQSLQSKPPDSTQRPIGRALLWPASAVALGALMLYSSVEGPTAAGQPGARPAAVASVAAPGTQSPAPLTDQELALPRSAPKRLSIPSIGVNAPFTPLTLGSKGQLNTPPTSNKNLVGWYKGGATPGEPGASIIAGHVDTKTGPAVFELLSLLKPGNTVDVTRQDDIVATFKIDSVETFSKANFPDQRVYADTPSPQLRLITCGGDYDHKAKDYEDNVVVFAHLDSAKAG